ncbi:GrpB family protein [Cyanobium sp. Candia 9D4]|uniref:GrpB family protein n=1 Tax=Cyanobium sp. Candia 9D4 TaxID=2823707 RepID=UPI0020CBE366|nr:GrpB family protein [Cyanobium sp. Candia 9D4]MCP9933367.1 GrpB family protein [Cyanobium sp. Candia 9D4]
MKIRLESPNPAWTEAFERHREHLLEALPIAGLFVDHIGSTSLGDISAKPIIDILVGLPDPSPLDAVIDPLLAAGYTYVEAFTGAMPYRRFFVRLQALSAGPLPRVIGPADALAFGRDYDSIANIHVMERGTDHWRRHIAFRDYLRAHSEVRLAYESLKLRIAKMDFEDPLDYNSFKADFIREHQGKAMAWFLQRGQ